jgi:hypothetical protein
VLKLFLKKHGMSNARAARTIKKSESFIDYLVSKLHSMHKSHYMTGMLDLEHCMFQQCHFPLLDQCRLFSSTSELITYRALIATTQMLFLVLVQTELFFEFCWYMLKYACRRKMFTGPFT